MTNLVDQFNRVHDYLRISITDSCNFRCLYCMPDENIQCLPKKELMQPDEIFKIAQIFVKYNIKKIRLTGGEPLVRRDFPEIIKKISTLPIELALTTNGVFIDKYIDLFKETKVKSLNISLDTLTNQTFLFLTKRNEFAKVWDNIVNFVEEGFQIKLNVVIIKGINDHEIINFLSLTQEMPIQIRFIEFMPFSGNKWEMNKVMTIKEMLAHVKKYFSIEKLEDKETDTAKKYQIKKAKGTFAIITTISQSFCDGCNRLRITADGKLKNCLFSKDESDILGALRNKKDINPIIEKCVNLKRKRNSIELDSNQNLNSLDLTQRSMIKIGG